MTAPITLPPDRWSPLPLAVVRLSGTRRLAVWGIAILFTLLAVHWSERNGRLAQDPTYDDVQYLIDGAQKLQVLDHEGCAGLIGDLIRRPPHSPFCTLLALASFQTFGVTDWAPYVFNGFVLAAYLFFCCRIFGDLPNTAFYCLLIFCLTIPFALRSIHDFRPDFPSALATAAFVWFGVAAALGSERDERANAVRAGVLLGAALWIKPTVFAHTIAIAMLVGGGIVASGWLPGPRRRGFKAGLFLALRFFFVGVAVAAPYYLVNGRQTFEYFTQNTRGADAHLYNFHGSTWEVLRAFVLDGAEAIFIGRYLWLLLAGWAFGLGWAIYRRRYLVAVQVAGLLLVAAASLTIFVAGRHNSEYFGLYYEIPVLVAALAALSVVIREQRSATVIAPGLLLVALTPFFYRGTPIWSPAPEANPVYGWNHKLVSALLDDSGFQRSDDAQIDPPIPVFVSFAGFVSSRSLEWICTKEKLPFAFSDLLLNGDAPTQMRSARASAYVAVATPDARSVYTHLPSAKTFATVLGELQRDPNFREVKVSAGSKPPYRLFRNTSAAGRFASDAVLEIPWPVTGFMPVEGPYPQWHLPKVRWGTFPRSTVVVTTPEACTGTLRFSATAPVGATLQIKVNGEPAGENVQLSSNRESAEVSLPLRAGENVVSLDYSVPNVKPVAGGRAFLFSDFKLAVPPKPAAAP